MTTWTSPTGVGLLTRDLTDEQRSMAQDRATKRCRFGQPHVMQTELDIAGTGLWTGWWVCADCCARDWEGPDETCGITDEDIRAAADRVNAQLREQAERRSAADLDSKEMTHA